MLKQRVITSLWLAPLAITVVWFGDIPLLLTACVAAIGLLAALEFYRMANKSGAQPLTAVGILFILILLAWREPLVNDYVNNLMNNAAILPTILTLGVILSLVLLLFRQNKLRVLYDGAWTWAGVFYIGWLLSFIISLRFIEDGRNWLYFALLCTFISDTSAFFVGRAFGKHKMMPMISPAKTWEGATGGFIGAGAVSLLFILPTPLSLSAHLYWWQAVLLGLMVSLFVQLGDMVESLIKRTTGVKDSGTIFPGHGGALDRIDGVIFAVMLVYYWVIWIAR